MTCTSENINITRLNNKTFMFVTKTKSKSIKKVIQICYTRQFIMCFEKLLKKIYNDLIKDYL